MLKTSLRKYSQNTSTLTSFAASSNLGKVAIVISLHLKVEYFGFILAFRFLNKVVIKQCLWEKKLKT